MVSPTPFTLFFTLLLCLPLAVIFTVTTPTTTVKSTPLLLPKLRSSTLPKDDDALLRLASRVDPNPNPNQPEKVAFLFLTTTPLPFAPLWELFFDGGKSKKDGEPLYNVYVHADPTKKYDLDFTGVFSGRVVHSKPTKRFSPTLIAAARRLLAHALLDDPSNSVFVLLSASCVPLHSFEFTYRTLTGSRKSFIEILANETTAFDRWTARGEDAMLPEVTLEDFRIGSQFWALTRKHARVVVEDRRIWAKFNRTCVRVDTCFPEENYFPTLIHMVDPSGATSATLTHVDWRGRFDGHPKTYKAEEVGPKLIESLRNRRPRYGYEEIVNGSDWSAERRRDPFLFARKFAAETIGPLLEIAEEVILRD
ncbi:Glycosyltransferase BC10 [Linum grandiflorum]